MYFHSKLAIIAFVLLCSRQSGAQFHTREYYKNKVNIDLSQVAIVDTVYRVWQSIEYYDVDRVLRYGIDIDTLRNDTMGFEQFDSLGHAFDFSFNTDKEGYFSAHVFSKGEVFGYRLRPSGEVGFIDWIDKNGIYKTIALYENSIIHIVTVDEAEAGSRQMIYSLSGELLFDGDFNKDKQIIHVRKGRRWAKRNYMKFAQR